MTQISVMNFYAISILTVFLIFLVALWRAQRARRLDWLDMITRDGTKVSTTKILQLIGGVVATWIIIQTTIQGKLTWDLFAIYLAYVASIDGYAKFIMAKYGAAGSDDSRVPYYARSSYSAVDPTAPYQPHYQPPYPYEQQYGAPTVDRTTDLSMQEENNRPAGGAKAP